MAREVLERGEFNEVFADSVDVRGWSEASATMRVLVVHNYYLQPGGEDTVFRLETELLRQHGHTVIEFVEDNKRITSMTGVSVAANTIWSRQTHRRLSKLLAEERPDVVHFHNFFPLISPSAYYACRTAGVPVVQTIHNQRLICPAATFYRDGKLCLDCFTKASPWPAVVHACYHRSRLQTGVIAGMITLHQRMGTWRDVVNVYIASTEFYRDIFSRAGLPAEKIVVKPHFVPAASRPDSCNGSGDYALYIGRLDPEKGVRTLLEAWKGLNVPLRIRGSGQLEGEARECVQRDSPTSVEFVGRLSEPELSTLIRNARFLVLPSEGYYETFGLVAVESFAHGVPVIASRIGVMTEIVQDGVTGLHFNPGDPKDLAEKVRSLWDRPDEARRMGWQARARYEASYTPDRNYEMLMSIYRMVVRSNGSAGTLPAG
jgi:glycosyltransferase involved in cell wall biosynthesis